MAIGEAKTDMTQGPAVVSRESGTGIGLAKQDNSAQDAFLAAAAQQLDALAIQDDTGEAPPKKKRKPRAVKEPEPEVEEELEEEPEDEGDLDEPEEEEEDAGEAPDDEGDEDEDPDAPRVSVRLDGKKATLEDVLPHLTATVRVDGEDIEVDGQELLKGYQRGADYSKKTTELQKAKTELMPYSQMVAFAKEDPQFIQYVQSYFQNGPYPELANNQDLRVTDAQLAQLLDPNSAEYDPTRATNVLKARSDWTSKSAERQRVMQAAQQQQMGMMQEWGQNQIALARQQIDALGEPAGDDGRGEYDRRSEQVLATVRAAGFNDAELQGATPLSALDARLAVLAYKASEYDRLQKETEAPRITLGTKRKRHAPPRSQQSGSGTRKASNRKRARDTSARAAKTQSSDDWTTAIAERLKL